ncbi:MAG: amidohydrolase, partial [Spirochaetes bacterium]
MKTVIKNGIVISMDSKLPRVIRGDIAIEGRKIVSVGDLPADFTADRTIDAETSIVLPCIINAHCHLSMV